MKRTVPYYPKNKWPLPTTTPQVEKPRINAPKNWQRLKLPQWKKQMFALQQKFPTGWEPVKRLNRYEMLKLRYTKQAYPSMTLNELGREFGVSPEAVRRILKSKFRTNQDKELDEE